MSSYIKKNPTHGQKVSTGKEDPKYEYAGPITSDSLAAESLRSGGQFSKGNPADILSVSGDHSTLASQPDPRAPHFQEIKPGHRKHDEEVFETGRKGGMDENLKTKAGRVGTLGGGNQTTEGFGVVDAQGNDTTTIETVRNPVPRRGDVEQHRHRKDDHTRLGLRGGMAPGEEGKQGQGLRSSKYAPSTTTYDSGTVGSRERKQEESPDWSKISKDTIPTTNIGSEEDPGRAAELHFAKSATRQEQSATQDQYEKSRGVAGEGGVVTGKENPYRDLNSDEAI
ncbi:hypothetical protein BDZ91DRAFT_800235 [Kalaharituber pfeilii]|nr:hypothetical protein BDZ91DRAFT_800235 [Kalaharituber pfeilii]